MALLLKFDSGLLNCQARCILGSDFHSISDSEITRRLNSYCYIATEQTLADLYQAFGFARSRAMPKSSARTQPQNTTSTPRSFKRPNFAHFSPITIATISPFTIWFGKRPGPRKGAVHSGRAFPIVTQENYGEQAYLDANPDVATAVCANEFRSGREHFDTSGHAEGRRKLVPPPVPPVLFAITGDAVRLQ